MNKGSKEMQGEQIDPRSEVYDLLGELDDTSIPHAKKLFVMGGQRGMAGGYFFEKDSSKFIHSTREVTISDEEGELVGKLHQDQVFYNFNVSLPDWLEEGKKYQLGEPQVNREEADKLWNIRNSILTRLRSEGLGAAKEFYLVGTLMGGEEEDMDTVASDIGSRIERMLQETEK